MSGSTREQGNEEPTLRVPAYRERDNVESLDTDGGEERVPAPGECCLTPVVPPPLLRPRIFSYMYFCCNPTREPYMLYYRG